jgi:hypothetical protein
MDYQTTVSALYATGLFLLALLAILPMFRPGNARPGGDNRK